MSPKANACGASLEVAGVCAVDSAWRPHGDSNPGSATLGILVSLDINGLNFCEVEMEPKKASSQGLAPNTIASHAGADE